MLEQQTASSRFVKFVAAIVCAALLGGLIAYWSIDTFEAQNASLKQQIADLETQIEELKNPPPPPPEAILSSLPTGMEIKFDSCGALASYSSKDWYAAFAQTAASAQLDVKNIKNVCYSENGKILVTLIPGDFKNCTNGIVARYDVTSGSIQQALINSKEQKCLGWPSQFGKREGTIIKMEGPAFGEGCKDKMYFDYDFVKNTMELKKVYTTCDDKPPQWTNY